MASNLSPVDDGTDEQDASFERLMDRFQEIADNVADADETMSMAERLILGTQAPADDVEPPADAG